MLTINMQPKGGMLFKNRKEIILRDPDFRLGYFKLREFRISNQLSYSEEQVIENFIKSRYFVWDYAKINTPKNNNPEKKNILDWNFHGIYDVTKIIPSDFKLTTYDSFKKSLLDFFDDKTKDNVVIEGSNNVLASITKNLKNILHNKIDEYKTIPKDADEINRFVNSMQKAIEEYNNPENKFYILTTTDKDKRHKNTVYAYFFSSVMINTATNTFVTIEFGLD